MCMDSSACTHAVAVTALFQQRPARRGGGSTRGWHQSDATQTVETAKSEIHAAVLSAFQEGDLPGLLTLISQRCEDFDSGAASTALHRVAKWWSRYGKREAAGSALARTTGEALILLSHRLATIFQQYLTGKAGMFEESTAEPRHVAITAWAFATLSRAKALKVKTSELTTVFASLSSIALRDMTSYDGQSLSNLLWGCAACRQVDKRVFNVAARRASQLLSDGVLRHQNLANVLWAYATARMPCPSLFSEVAQLRDEIFKSGSLNSQHITNMLWSFSRIHGKQGIYKEFCDAAAEAARVRCFSGSTVCIVVGARSAFPVEVSSGVGRLRC
eukprot:TRINITY_DN36581_c0_g1_i7.p1 TRINITY_DN36581_c0_g1~~TRINITY_DN36581_c0_g1_i7.p1  ORF type:complete len:331 (+),score=54.34 TRINITY_DN36581_c0_g1_i7:207-1199(+)